MLKAKPPFKLTVAAAFLEKSHLEATEVYAELLAEYRDAKYFSLAGVQGALHSLKTVGILNLVEDAGGKSLYCLTGSGKNKVLRSL